MGAATWRCRSFEDNPYCTRTDPCFECAITAHDELHPDLDVDGCDTCRLAFLQVSPQVTGPTIRSSKRRVRDPANHNHNSWERQIVTDGRGMPILRPDGNLIRSKEYGEDRHTIEEGRRRLHNGEF